MENDLGEFRQVLKNYHVSDHARDLLRKAKLVLLVSPSASGRNTIIRELIKKENYHYIVSDTTRKPRINDGVLEKHGHQYWFKTDEEVLNDLKKGEYLEAAIIHNQQVSGINVKELEYAASSNKFALKDIEVQGADTIFNISPNVVCLFIIAPSYEEWLKRLDNRGDMSPVEKNRRLASAISELKAALAADHYIYIVNDDLTLVVKEIDEIIRTNKVDLNLQQRGKQVAEDLLKKAQASLTDQK